MTELRPRQVKALQDLKAAYAQGSRAAVLLAATGFGKTHTAAQVIKDATSRGETVWFLAHLREILEDTCRRLDSAGVAYSRIMAGAPTQPSCGVYVVSVQTAARRRDLPKPDLVIVDECHLAVAATYQGVLERLGNPRLLGLTGTAARLDGRGLGELFDTLVPTCSTRDLIQEGLLAPIRYYAPSKPDLRGVKVRAGDYAAEQLAETMDRATLTGDAVAHYQRVCPGKRAVAFCTTVAHAEHVAQEFVEAGFRATTVHGKLPKGERDEVLRALRRGDLDVVCNAQLWVAGVDVPELECIILLRPTKSLTFYLQAIGRGLRTAPGKEACVVLDHAGCIFEHGAPDAPRTWSLDAKRKRRGAAAPSVRECPSCFAAHEPSPVCPLCGFEYPKRERGGPEHVEGELGAVDLRTVRARERAEAKEAERQERVALERDRLRQQGAARTMEQLVRLAKERGYSNPRAWATHVLNARRRLSAA